jgi:hypothetical protein
MRNALINLWLHRNTGKGRPASAGDQAIPLPWLASNPTCGGGSDQIASPLIKMGALVVRAIQMQV